MCLSRITHSALAPLRELFVLLACSVIVAAVGTAAAAELDPIKIALLVDGMASRGSGYDATELHALGEDGLAAVLNYLLPDTAPPAPPLPPGPPAEEVHRLIAQLDADEFAVREQATERLIAEGRGRKKLIEDAGQSESAEVRFRTERILASWEARPASRLGGYLSGFWPYLEGIDDPPRLMLLAARTVKALEPGMPEGDRLHLLRLCIAGVAHGRDDASCDALRPLLRGPDPRIATLVAETVGAYKTQPRFVPQLLVDALTSEHKPVVEAALRFVVGCQDEKRREAVRGALRTVFLGSDEGLKFQACLPLLRDFGDADAWIYVLDQVASPDASRLRTAFNWIGDTKNNGQPVPVPLLARIDQLLAASGEQRRAAVQTLGLFTGADVTQRLLALSTDGDANVARQAQEGLRSQPTAEGVSRLRGALLPVDAAGRGPSERRAAQ